MYDTRGDTTIVTGVTPMEIGRIDGFRIIEDELSDPVQSAEAPETRDLNTPVRWGNNKRRVSATRKKTRARIAAASRRRNRA